MDIHSPLYWCSVCLQQELLHFFLTGRQGWKSCGFPWWRVEKICCWQTGLRRHTEVSMRHSAEDLGMQETGLVVGTWRCSHPKTAGSYSMRTEDSTVCSLSQVLYWFISSWADQCTRAFISVFINWCDFSLGFCCCSGQGDKTLKEMNMPQCFVDVRKASRKAWSEII